MLGDNQVERHGPIVEQTPDGRHVEHGLRGLSNLVQTEHVHQHADDAEIPGSAWERDIVVGHGHGARDADVGNVRVRRIEIANYVHIVSAVCQCPQVRQEHHVMAVPVVREHSENTSRGRAVKRGHRGRDEKIRHSGVHHNFPCSVARTNIRLIVGTLT